MALKDLGLRVKLGDRVGMVTVAATFGKSQGASSAGVFLYSWAPHGVLLHLAKRKGQPDYPSCALGPYHIHGDMSPSNAHQSPVKSIRVRRIEPDQSADWRSIRYCSQASQSHSTE